MDEQNSRVGHIHAIISVNVNSAFTALCVSLDHNMFTVKIYARSFSYILPLLSHHIRTLLFELFF